MTNLEADVVVIAAGAAGLAAPIAAAEKGVKVIVFEKASITGGTGSMGMGRRKGQAFSLIWYRAGL